MSLKNFQSVLRAMHSMLRYDFHSLEKNAAFSCTFYLGYNISSKDRLRFLTLSCDVRDAAWNKLFAVMVMDVLGQRKYREYWWSRM